MLMEPHDDLKIYTLRHFLFYMGIAALAGAVIGVLAGLMDWSSGLIYGIGLPACTLIVTVALRESLFGPPRHSGEPRHRRHA